MRPGPDNLKTCPHCGTYYSQPTLYSGNTFRATYWTDGKMEAPSLPQYPDIIECFSCSAIFLISEQPKIDEREPVILNWRFLEKFRSGHPGWAGAHDLLHHRTSAQTYLKCINLDKVKQHDEYPEIELRMSAWHRFNDQYRDAEAPKGIKWTSKQLQNADALTGLLDDTYSSDRILKAEIYRQRGNF